MQPDTKVTSWYDFNHLRFRVKNGVTHFPASVTGWCFRPSTKPWFVASFLTFFADST